MQRIGVHTSIAGGIHKSLERAHELGCNTLQIFSHNPRGWAIRDIASDEIKTFKRLKKKYYISPVFIHTSYLINPASAKEELRKKSLEMILHELDMADRIDAKYVVLHPGSASGDDPDIARKRVIECLGRIGEKRKFKAGLLLENTSGMRGDISSTIKDLSEIIRKVPKGVVSGICLDSCHAYAAGYNLRTKKGVNTLADEIHQYLGDGAVKLLHLNDSKKAMGSGLDRHEHLGKGAIGTAGLKKLLNHDAFRDLPVILETPKKTKEDDIMNLNKVRKLIGKP